MAQDAIAPADEQSDQVPPAADSMPQDDARSETGNGSGVSGETNASPRESSGLPTPQAVRIVAPSVLSVATRVDQIDRDREDGAILASTLADAVDLAMRFGIGRVEIDVADLVTGPVAIPQDNMTFVSTAGRSLIRMVSINTLTIERSEMLNLGNHRTEFKNLDFHWELSQEQIDGGAMFVINDSRLTRFQNCTFTLVNPAIQDGVSFFEIVTDPDALPDSDTLPGRMFNPDENALPFVALQLDNAIIRGEADLIEMDYAAALQLAWNNGLLAISGRGIDTAGARRRPGATAGSIQLSLSNLTAEIPRGLLRMDLGDEGRHAVSIEREANQCVFLVDSGQPHIEVLNLESVSGERPEVSLRGEDNAYVGSSTLDAAIVTLTDRQGDSATVLMSELAASDDELRPRNSVRWSTPTPQANSQTYHRVTPNQYRQDGAIYFGFQELNLPPLP
jgi:serine/threonine-protein kinase